ADHIYASGVFPLLESITYPTIYYTDVQLNTTDSTLVLSGIAADFNSLSLQLRGYDSAKDMISSYVLNQSRVVANQVNFRITLNLSSKVFKK
ncbi:MAG: hypothetical protein M1155_02580, partial [Patescibacteria group bacterium]|nr:hypothetical protein [Patescibacteria group bacterium]